MFIEQLHDITTLNARRDLKIRKQPYWHHIKTNRSLGFRWASANRGVWVARYRRRDGLYRRIPVGVAEGSELDTERCFTFKEALETANRLMCSPDITSEAAEAIDRTLPQELAYCPWGDVYTVGHALSEYAAWIKVSGAYSHYLGVRTRCNCYLLDAFGTIPCEAMTRERLREFVEEFFKLSAAAGGKRPEHRMEPTDWDEETLAKRKRTLNMLIGTLRSALQYAWEDGKFQNENAWRCLRFVSYVKRRRLMYLSPPQIDQLLQSCTQEMRNLVLGALLTGCRFRELRNLRAQDVARDGYGLHIEPGKSKKPRFVFLSDEGMRFFLDQVLGKDDLDHVFTNSKGRPWTTAYCVSFRKAVKRAKLPFKFDFHGLRHTYATTLVHAGTPFNAVADQLGHAGPETVMMYYAHFAPQIRESEIRTRLPRIGAFNEPLATAEIERRFSERSGRRPTNYADISQKPIDQRAAFIKGDMETELAIRRATGRDKTTYRGNVPDPSQ